ncbi:GPI mannosyltransferase 1 [Anoplophora glabripennis]|uniref:GPI mannosyltransferase 1 n=1 Tax=Anoplophora glabripennis TaxID=217634 RepID=UPI000873977C|nr:GPI mannosyltransferase 1 [Anoplophora glabripennis]
MYSVFHRFVNIDYKVHLLFSLFVRLLLIAYGIYHDQISEVKYTDIDYKVFTDASRHILKGESPYERHTYRYSPLVALALVPNITIHHSFGKILFSLVDIVVAVLIRLIVRNALDEYEMYKHKNQNDQKRRYSESKKPFPVKHRKRPRQSYKKVSSHIEKYEFDSKSYLDRMVNISMLVWLYNPLTIAIGTRGNCDSLAGFLVLLTLYTLQCKGWYFIAGVIHGLSVHFRIYPLIYSLTYFMFLSKFSFYSTEDRKKSFVKAIAPSANLKPLDNVENIIAESSSLGGHKIVPYDAKERKTVFKKEYLLYLIPNFDQLKLITGCILSLSCLTWTFYELYGHKFLYEAYIYHLVRKDTRHNFSLYFYLQYLTAWVKNIGIWQKVLMVLPQLVLILVFSVRYGLNKFSLNFSILTQTIVMVIYNGVLTSQYFVWVMAVIPLCLWQVNMPKKTVALLLTIWFAAQGAWLLPAYLLEFHGQNTFLFIWIQSVSFFCANIAVLGRLIMYFMPVKRRLE